MFVAVGLSVGCFVLPLIFLENTILVDPLIFCFFVTIVRILIWFAVTILILLLYKNGAMFGLLIMFSVNLCRCFTPLKRVWKTRIIVTGWRL